jgi:hypothetical protein
MYLKPTTIQKQKSGRNSAQAPDFSANTVLWGGASIIQNGNSKVKQNLSPTNPLLD